MVRVLDEAQARIRQLPIQTRFKISAQRQFEEDQDFMASLVDDLPRKRRAMGDAAGKDPTPSNTTSANMVVPIAIAVAQAAGVRAVEPALGATLGASMGFMMPISTPPNAIVYSSGYISIGQMMRHGVLLDLVGFVVIVTSVLTLAPLVF